MKSMGREIIEQLYSKIIMTLSYSIFNAEDLTWLINIFEALIEELKRMQEEDSRF